jgi:pimeloyl-ACP methyl ester carboxylesterase
LCGERLDIAASAASRVSSGRPGRDARFGERGGQRVTATVVLVHGAWHGAWCWERVTPLLAAAGVPHRAIDLPGHGDDRRPFADLYGDADAVSAELDSIEGPVVLVGHSYGGAVITDAGVHERVQHLVYLTAFALDARESLAAAVVDEAAAADIQHVSPGLGDLMTVHDDGTSTLPAAAVADLLYNACDPPTQRWATERVGAQPLANMAQSPRAVAWRSRASTYVVCERDRAIVPPLQRSMASRCTATHSLDVDHSPFASNPAALTDILAELAQRY